MNSKSSLHAVPGPAGPPVIFSLNRFWLKCGFEPVAQRLDITLWKPLVPGITLGDSGLVRLAYESAENAMSFCASSILRRSANAALIEW